MIDFGQGIVNPGNWDRLRRAMDRGRAGESLTIGFIGGSITQGSLATVPENCYAHLVYRWWAERFPNVRWINAGIGGTTSQFGAARVEEDLLSFGPDVVVIEFSVNDENTEFYRETYEGLVRRCLKTEAAVILLHNVCYDTLASAEEMHLAVGKHYDLPCVSIRSVICPALEAGILSNRDITPDDLHPNDRGHGLVAQAIIHLLDRVYAEKARQTESAALPQPLTRNAYENSVRYQNSNCTPVLEGFLPDDTPQTHITQMFRRGYTAGKRGDAITFFVEGTEIAVQYRKSVKKPAPIAKVTVDDGAEILLDANFQEDWGDCLYIDTVLHHGENRVHKVKIEIIQARDDDVVPFYLVSVIGSH